LKQRIQTLDGLRFLAALGVLWIHTWTAHGNPRWFIGKVDMANFMAIGVNGVELFFVISGFCMYYFYASKIDFSYRDYSRFLFKRWVRLSPAFYAITVIYVLIDKLIYHQNISPLLFFVHSAFYLNFILAGYGAASHFWTLSVEWQFYFVIPFLLIYQNKIGFKKTFVIIFGLIVLAAITSVFILKNTNDDFTITLLFRGVEFGFGVIAARLLIKTNAYFKNRKLWFIAFIVITYTGRVLVSKPVLSLSFYYYNLYKLSGFTLMGLGFAGILYLSVTSQKWLSLFLGNRFFKKMGRISYSFYLFHALIYPIVVGYIITHTPFLTGIAAPIVSTIISAVILYPVSVLSFNLLEKPFLSIGNLTAK
jgi:peptidoglycan/LPS O-acetylase OafA/YrhL